MRAPNRAGGFGILILIAIVLGYFAVEIWEVLPR